MSAPLVDEARADRFLGGTVTLMQPVKGHRAGLDAALLQATVATDRTGTAVDLGTGCGTVAFCVAARAPALRVVGIDADPAILAFARRGLAQPENGGFRPRLRLVELNVAASRVAREAAGLADSSADIVLMNPPYSAERSVRASPDPARRRAHVAGDDTPLAVWSRMAAALSRQGGQLSLIHRPDALVEILAGLAGRFGGITVLPVHPRAGRPAGRVLVGGVRGSRAPLSLLPGLVLHNDDGSWTHTAAAILNGKRDLARWPAP